MDDISPLPPPWSIISPSQREQEETVSPRMWQMTNKKIEERAAKLEICLYLIIIIGNTGSVQCQVCSWPITGIHCKATFDKIKQITGNMIANISPTTITEAFVACPKLTTKLKALMPTLTDYPVVSRTQNESPCLPYGSPNLPDKSDFG